MWLGYYSNVFEIVKISVARNGLDELPLLSRRKYGNVRSGTEFEDDM